MKLKTLNYAPVQSCSADLYRVSSEMQFKSCFSSEALATLIAIELLLLEVDENSKMDQLANVKFFNLTN